MGVQGKLQLRRLMLCSGGALRLRHRRRVACAEVFDVGIVINDRVVSHFELRFRYGPRGAGLGVRSSIILTRSSIDHRLSVNPAAMAGVCSLARSAFFSLA